ncbi:MAG: hypothetical protein KA297_09040 [Kofleriaceae bacterium]|jgi:putative sigma-54 modulation protein|nr:hypothetical protein [Kofleriaceae bacterium]MBP6836964.1 hypothetical protein [Kofleriaceae bacterium]
MLLVFFLIVGRHDRTHPGALNNPFPTKELPMEISIKARGVELAAELHDQVVRRLQFALGRFRQAIPRVDLVISDDNGPRGGRDKRIQLRVHGRKQLIVLEHDGSILAAVSRAADRMARVVVKALHRERAHVAAPTASPALALALAGAAAGRRSS